MSASGKEWESVGVDALWEVGSVAMMEIRVHDARDGAVLLCGVPFPEGGLQPGEVLGAWDDDGRSLPLWWEERAYWGDGSVKWIFLHVRLGEVVEVVRVGPADTAAELPPPPLLVRPDAETSLLRVGDFTLRMGRDAWVLTCASGTCRIEPTRIFTNPEQEHGGAWHVDVVEPSPLAPLLRVREKASAGACLDHLLRVDPLRATLDWQQRVRFLASETCALRALETVIDFSTETRANSWTWEVSPAPRSRLLVPRPGILVLDGGMEQDGRPRMAMHGALGSIELIKGWQRAPCALKVEAGGRVHVEMYPQDVPGLVVRPGTSFRHWVRLGVGRKAAQQARWSLDPEAACASGAFGPVMARTERSQRLFPGYEQAIRLCLDGGRLARLDKEGAETQGPPAALADEEAQDEEYFGLQHYGDWPMKLGAYGGTRRMYADNEYDTPYAYALQFARTGNPDYWNIAYWSAVHMADVDCKATDGDMRYHGYRDTAEDHGEHRTPGGDLGHVWTDGLVLNYLLAGDVWCWEAAQALVQVLLETFRGDGDDPVRRHFLGCERTVGWPMIALAGVVEVTRDPALLAKMRQMAGYLARFAADPDREVEEITTVQGEPVRWWRVGQEDGSKPFMLGVVLEGLERYHRLTEDPLAAAAALDIARFLVDVMWVPGVEAFVYEWNAFNRLHREDVYPHYINMMVAPGLAFAYESSGDELLRSVATRAFHSAIWTLVTPGGGKEIGMVGRTSALMVARLHEWFQRDETTRAGRLRPSQGVPFSFSGSAADLEKCPSLMLRQGRPRYAQQALLSADDSYQVFSFRDPAATEHGLIEFRFTPTWDCPAHPGPVAQRAYLHLCDRPFTRSCVSVISFYTGLHVRFYDAQRSYIEVLETDIQDWKAGQPHTVSIRWDTARGEAVLWVDGQERDRRPLRRRLSGVFQRLHVGHRPGNWRADGALTAFHVELGA